MKLADAQKIVDDLTDENVKSIILGLFTELRDRPNYGGAAESIIENYQQRIVNQDKAHALVTDFITKNFTAAAVGKKARRK